MSSGEIDHLVQLLSKLPGLGKRSARRAVLHLIENKEVLFNPLIESMKNTFHTVGVCDVCGNIDSQNPCGICNDHKRMDNILCVVEEVSDLWAIERGNIFRGRYHVLGGTLSALEGIGPDDLNINTLITRIDQASEAEESPIEEIILATNATVEGQTTAHYITERLKENEVKITQIAHGIPMGGELDYLDDGTLNAALNARRAF